MMDLDLEIVRRAARLLLARISESLGDRVEVGGGFYWSLDASKIADPYHDPGGPALGSVDDCMDRLQKLVDDPDRAFAYDLVRLGDIFRVLGSALPPASLTATE